MQIKQLPALSDNYIYLIECQNGSICIDPGDVKPVLEAVEGGLIAIMNTHHHDDHIAGNAELKRHFECPLIAPDDERIADCDLIAQEGSPLTVDEATFTVFFVPGHTKTHIAFYLPTQKAVFTGDSLFCGGCGRLFEGTPADMLTSLKKLAALPPDTNVYCGHEYTQINLAFAHQLEPDNEKVKKRLNSHPMVPSTIAEELETNPFLRAKEVLQMDDELAAFTQLRQLKDNFSQ